MRGLMKVAGVIDDFKDAIRNADDPESVWKEYAFENHPDRGGDTSTFQSLQDLWETYQESGSFSDDFGGFSGGSSSGSSRSSYRGSSGGSYGSSSRGYSSDDFHHDFDFDDFDFDDFEFDGDFGVDWEDVKIDPTDYQRNNVLESSMIGAGALHDLYKFRGESENKAQEDAKAKALGSIIGGVGGGALASDSKLFGTSEGVFTGQLGGYGLGSLAAALNDDESLSDRRKKIRESDDYSSTDVGVLSGIFSDAVRRL